MPKKSQETHFQIYEKTLYGTVENFGQNPANPKTILDKKCQFFANMGGQSPLFVGVQTSPHRDYKMLKTH